MQKQEYITIVNSERAELRADVTRHIDEGWDPYGPERRTLISDNQFRYDETWAGIEVAYYQMMVKYAEAAQ